MNSLISPNISQMELKEFKSADLSVAWPSKRVVMSSSLTLPMSPRTQPSQQSRSFGSVKFSSRDKDLPCVSRKKSISQFICKLDSNDEHNKSRSMRRAMSETDLQRMQRQAQSGKISRRGSSNSNDFVPSPLSQSVSEESSSINDMMPKNVQGENQNGHPLSSYGSRAGRDVESQTDFVHQGTHNEKYNDDVMYSSGPGRPLVCNSKGCKPVGMDEDDVFTLSDLGIGSSGEDLLGARIRSSSSCSGLNLIQAERHYQESLESDPGNPLLLHNYARFLHEVKQIKTRLDYFVILMVSSISGGEKLLQSRRVL